jgi:hypothetical protein
MSLLCLPDGNYPLGFILWNCNTKAISIGNLSQRVKRVAGTRCAVLPPIYGLLR